MRTQPPRIDPTVLGLASSLLTPANNGRGAKSMIRHKPLILSQFTFDSAAPIPPEQSIFEGLVAKGDLTVWLGREKHRKSTVLLQFAICAAVGRPFLHFRFCPSVAFRVVILDYESKTQSLRNRYTAITAAMKLSESEQRMLGVNLRIIEMRKAFRLGVQFARFPIKPDRGQADEFAEAEEQWRSFLKDFAAEIYVIDPMRCMHAQAENDSAIETLLTRIHQFFGDATVVISHHLRKRNRKKQDQPKLKDDMRAWADEARGSSAITAHADVIVCQERVIDKDLEVLYLGAYLRDGADIEPIVLRESDHESFFWEVSPDIPLELIRCMDVLRGESPLDRSAAVILLGRTLGIGRSTAYNRVRDMENRGLVRLDQPAPAYRPTPSIRRSPATPRRVSMNPSSFVSEDA